MNYWRNFSENSRKPLGRICKSIFVRFKKKKIEEEFLKNSKETLLKESLAKNSDVFFTILIFLKVFQEEYQQKFVKEALMEFVKKFPFEFMWKFQKYYCKTEDIPGKSLMEFQKEVLKNFLTIFFFTTSSKNPWWNFSKSFFRPLKRCTDFWIN